MTRSRSRVEPILPVARAPATTPRVRTLPSLPRRSPACPPALWRLRSPPSPRAARIVKTSTTARTLKLGTLRRMCVDRAYQFAFGSRLVRVSRRVVLEAFYFFRDAADRARVRACTALLPSPPSPLRGRPASIIDVCEERRTAPSWEPRGAEPPMTARLYRYIRVYMYIARRDEVEVRRRFSSTDFARCAAHNSTRLFDLTSKRNPLPVRPILGPLGQRCERLEDSDGCNSIPHGLHRYPFRPCLLTTMPKPPVVDLHLNSNHHGTYRMEMACRRAVGGSLSARSHQSRTAGSLTAGSRQKVGESRRHHSTRFAAASL